MIIKEKIVNLETGEETINEREETAQEQTERLDYEAKVEAEKVKAEAKATARAAVLDKLGLTADEMTTLLS